MKKITLIWSVLETTLLYFQNERAALWNLISHAGRIVYFSLSSVLLSRPSSSKVTVSNRHRDVLFTNGVASDLCRTMQHHRGKCLCEETGGKMMDQLTAGCCIKSYDFKLNQLPWAFYFLSYHGILKTFVRSIKWKKAMSAFMLEIFKLNVLKKVMGRDSGFDWSHLFAMFINWKICLKSIWWK